MDDGRYRGSTGDDGIGLLPDMKANPDLEGMPLLARGQRLSVQPVSEEHFRLVCRMGGLEGVADE